MVHVRGMADWPSRFSRCLRECLLSVEYVVTSVVLLGRRWIWSGRGSGLDVRGRVLLAGSEFV